jgi:hypothetical protein
MEALVVIVHTIVAQKNTLHGAKGESGGIAWSQVWPVGAAKLFKMSIGWFLLEDFLKRCE